MALRYADGSVILGGVITVEEAEPLCQMLASHPDAGIDLTDCLHAHAAAVQVLLAARRGVAGPPSDPFLARFVMPALLQDGVVPAGGQDAPPGATKREDPHARG